MAQATASWGLLPPTREVVMAQGRPDLTKIIDVVEQAETLGFGSVWVGDSILARPRLEALTTLAGVAAGAQTVVVRFGGPDQFGQLERCAKEVLPPLA